MIGKKVFNFVTALCVLCCSTSCGLDDYKTPEQRAGEQATKIFEYILQKDSSSLEDMFSKYVKDNHDLSAEINDAFAFFDGEIDSYDEPTGNTCSKELSEKGLKELKFRGKVNNIETEKGSNYSIVISSYDTYVDNTDLEGVCFIRLVKEDLYDKEDGYPEEAFCDIGEDFN